MITDQNTVQAFNDVGLWILISIFLSFAAPIIAVILNGLVGGWLEARERARIDGHVNEYIARRESEYAARKAERAARRA